MDGERGTGQWRETRKLVPSRHLAGACGAARGHGGDDTRGARRAASTPRRSSLASDARRWEPMMPARTIFLTLCAVAFSAVGQLLLKAGARQLAGLERLEFFLAAARNGHVLAGLASWTAWTLCWLYVLRVAPLSRAYGLTSLNYVIVTLASVYCFGEPLRPLQTVGVALIAIGIACLLSGD